MRKNRIRTEEAGGERAEAQVSVNPISSHASVGKQNESEQGVSHGLSAIKKVLIGMLCWREGSKRVETEGGDWRAATEPVAGHLGAWDGRGSTVVSPLWQRRILMGERCELPRFSGLILYDEQGRPLNTSSNKENSYQENPAPAVTTLKDLL